VPNINDRLIKSLTKPKSKYQIFCNNQFVGFGHKNYQQMQDLLFYAMWLVVENANTSYTTG